MERRDIIKEQIEQMGKAISKILTDLAGIDSTAKVAIVMQATDEQLQTMLDMDISALLLLSKSELAGHLTTKGCKVQHLEDLAQCLLEMAKWQNNDAQALRKKALELYDLADDFSATYSFERVAKKLEIKALF